MDRPLKVLVVEDHPETLDLLRRLFAKSNILAEQALSLNDALRLLHDDGFNVILLDLTLPDSAGEDGVATLQQECPKVPVVVYTGAGSEMEAPCLKAGAEDFIHKARTSGEELIERIRFAVLRHERSLRLFTPLMETLESAKKLAQDGSASAKVPSGTDTHPVLPVDEIEARKPSP